MSIAQVDWTLYGERELAALGSQRPAADLLAIQETLLAAAITRVGEVQAAEWALDQAKCACVVQIAAALSADHEGRRAAEVQRSACSSLHNPNNADVDVRVFGC